MRYGVNKLWCELKDQLDLDKLKPITIRNKRDLKQDGLHLRSKFCDPSLNRSRVLALTKNVEEQTGWRRKRQSCFYSRPFLIPSVGLSINHFVYKKTLHPFKQGSTNFDQRYKTTRLSFPLFWGAHRPWPARLNWTYHQTSNIRGTWEAMKLLITQM